MSTNDKRLYLDALNYFRSINESITEPEELARIMIEIRRATIFECISKFDISGPEADKLRELLKC